MLRELADKFGWGTTCILLGVTGGTMASWAWTKVEISNAARAHIWLVWSLLLRPGQIQTAFDIATCGRFTESGGPQHAGTGPVEVMTPDVKPPPIAKRPKKKRNK
jgi:hypothetical protein